MCVQHMHACRNPNEPQTDLARKRMGSIHFAMEPVATCSYQIEWHEQ